jgi:very-short-patch-repair endonuclease
MERQAGMVSAAQLRLAGFGPNAVQRRDRQRHWRRVHRGVYTPGGAPITFRGRLWAAHLATGGVVSHRSAAALWDLLPVPGGPVDVIAKGDDAKGIRVHRLRSFDRARDAVLHDALPLTSPMRTIYDLAPSTTDHRVERLCHRAEYLGILDVRALQALPPRRRLQKALDSLADTGPQLTRSELEELFLEIVAEAGLPRPRVNTVVAGYEIDFLWPDLRLAVEVDGAAAHLNAAAFEADRLRDANLHLLGIRTVRLTHRRIAHDRPGVLATLRQMAS